MLFTPDQISEILEEVDYQSAVLIASILGNEFLTTEDSKILKKYKVDLSKLMIKFPPYQQAYLFGRLTGVLKPNQTSSLSYGDFLDYLKKNQYVYPTLREQAEFEIVGKRSYSYIKGLGTRIKEEVTNYISDSELELLNKERAKKLEIIKDEMEDAVLRRSSIQQVSSNIAKRLNDYQRDWGRIVETEFQNIYNLGQAQMILDEHGEDAKVYKEVFPQACRHCIHLYLTNGIGSKPKIFTVSELIGNGTNIGRKVDDWKPTLSPVHPYCFNSPDTKIVTFEGLKPISEIKEGDLVLTHKKRFRKVTKTMKRPSMYNEQKVLDIVYGTGQPFNPFFWKKWVARKTMHRITGNHPVLSSYQWIPAKNLQKEKFLNYLWISKKDFGNPDLLDDYKCPNIINYQKVCIYDIKEHKGIYKNMSPYLYNFSVEEDESYVADGIVVHNCRCDLRYIPDGYVWDDKEGEFVRAKVSDEERIPRKSKVKVTIGDKNFEV